MCKITVIDSPMGSGKTTWAISKLLNKNPENNYIYITPFLSEIDRVIEATKDHKRFKAPENKGDGKLAAINTLLSNEDDIAATHELFKHLNEESREYIQRGSYTLILDEVLDVISPYSLKEGDLKLLQDGNWITIDEDGFLIWNSEVPNYDSTFEDVRLLAENHSLVYVNDRLLVWRYPHEIFNMFDKIYILTYMFEASILCAYFKFNKIEYEKKSICKDDVTGYQICEFEHFNPSIYASLINIYDGVMNTNIPQKKYTMSKTWFDNKENLKKIKQLKDNIYNYLRHILNAKAGTIMWTCFKDSFEKLKGNGYSKSHVSCTCRSTNEYGDRINLVYAVNRFLHPAIKQYFDKKSIELDEDLYALSEMIQWIWRSGIRNGEQINIYVTSKRMRSLLKKWLSDTL